MDNTSRRETSGTPAIGASTISAGFGGRTGATDSSGIRTATGSAGSGASTACDISGDGSGTGIAGGCRSRCPDSASCSPTSGGAKSGDATSSGSASCNARPFGSAASDTGTGGDTIIGVGAGSSVRASAGGSTGTTGSAGWPPLTATSTACTKFDAESNRASGRSASPVASTFRTATRCSGVNRPESAPSCSPAPAGRRPVKSSWAMAASEYTSARAFQGSPLVRSGAVYGRRTGTRAPTLSSASAMPTPVMRTSPFRPAISTSRGCSDPCRSPARCASSMTAANC